MFKSSLNEAFRRVRLINETSDKNIEGPRFKIWTDHQTYLMEVDGLDIRLNGKVGKSTPHGYSPICGEYYVRGQYQSATNVLEICHDGPDFLVLIEEEDGTVVKRLVRVDLHKVILEDVKRQLSA